MDNHAAHMDIRVMERPFGFRSGHFRNGRDYENVRPAGGADWLLIYTVDGAGFHRRPHGGPASPTRRRSSRELPRRSGGAGTEDLLRLDPGSVLLYAPGVPQHYGTLQAAGLWELLWTHFPSDGRLDPHLAWPALPGGARHLALGHAASEVRAAMLELVRWQSGGSPHRLEFASNALERVILWCNTENPHNPRSGMDPRVRSALELLARSPAAPWTVATVAREIGISPSRLSHLFRRETGGSLPEVLEARRMERACDLLRMSARGVAEIARAVGYTDPLYFSRRFRRRHGTSPSRWRPAAATAGGATG